MVRLRVARQLSAWALLGSGVGCAHVAPYERAVLARPDMTTQDLSGRAAQHATQVHEGATQGGSIAEVGCGCN